MSRQKGEVAGVIRNNPADLPAGQALPDPPGRRAGHPGVRTLPPSAAPEPRPILDE
jgi:hypothetical protein